MAMAGDLLNALGALLNNSLNALPGIVAAIIVLVLGYLIAALIGWVVREFLERVQLDKRIHRVCKVGVICEAEFSGIVGSIIKWYIFILFLGQSVELVNLGVLTGFLEQVVMWLPNLIVAVVFILLALVVADYVAHKVVATKVRGATWVSQILYYTIIVLVGIVALNQIGIDVTLLENLVLYVVGSLALGIALALGISLGLGLKDDAKKFLKDIKR